MGCWVTQKDGRASPVRFDEKSGLKNCGPQGVNYNVCIENTSHHPMAMPREVTVGVGFAVFADITQADRVQGVSTLLCLELRL